MKKNKFIFKFLASFLALTILFGSSTPILSHAEEDSRNMSLPLEYKWTNLDKELKYEVDTPASEVAKEIEYKSSIDSDVFAPITLTIPAGAMEKVGEHQLTITAHPDKYPESKLGVEAVSGEGNADFAFNLPIRKGDLGETADYRLKVYIENENGEVKETTVEGKVADLEANEETDKISIQSKAYSALNEYKMTRLIFSTHDVVGGEVVEEGFYTKNIEVKFLGDRTDLNFRYFTDVPSNQTLEPKEDVSIVKTFTITEKAAEVEENKTLDTIKLKEDAKPIEIHEEKDITNEKILALFENVPEDVTLGNLILSDVDLTEVGTHDISVEFQHEGKTRTLSFQVKVLAEEATNKYELKDNKILVSIGDKLSGKLFRDLFKEELNEKDVIKFEGENGLDIDTSYANHKEVKFSIVTEDNVEKEFTVDVYVGQIIERLAGKDRIHTSIHVMHNNENGQKSVFLVNKEAYADALSATPLAKALQGSILFTGSEKLHTNVKDMLIEKKIQDVYIVGGTNSISEEVEKEVKDMGINIQRIAGVDRYETSLEVAKELSKVLDKNFEGVVIASGEDATAADGLVAGPYAIMKGYPVLLAKHDSISESIKDYVKDMSNENIILIGGEKSVSDGGIENVIRISGKDRFETSIQVASIMRTENKDWNGVSAILTNGYSFADSLVAGPYAGELKAPILLTKKENNLKEINDFLDRHFFYVEKIGGTATID